MTENADIREGDTLSVRCPDCGGELRADKHFVFRRGHSMTNPEEQEPFWSTTCLACRHRFNYVPASGEIRRFEP
jgi:ribosomal protein S27E